MIINTLKKITTAWSVLIAIGIADHRLHKLYHVDLFKKYLKVVVQRQSRPTTELMSRRSNIKLNMSSAALNGVEKYMCWWMVYVYRILRKLLRCCVCVINNIYQGAYTSGSMVSDIANLRNDPVGKLGNSFYFEEYTHLGDCGLMKKLKNSALMDSASLSAYIIRWISLNIVRFLHLYSTSLVRKVVLFLAH